MATNPTGEALRKAAQEGRTDDVKALIKDGADVHAAGPVGAARPSWRARPRDTPAARSLVGRRSCTRAKTATPM